MSTPLDKSEFEALADFRYRLRRFLRFSELLTRRHGITNLQYLLLLQIKGFPGREWAFVGELAERLPEDRFVRIHRSTIVHARYVVRLRPHINGEYFVDLDGGHELKLSRGYREQLDKLA